MGSNRTASLIVRAAVRGVVDFSHAKLLDRHWWLRLHILLDEVENEDMIELAKQAFLFHMLTAANGAISEQSFDTARKTAKTMFKRIDSWLRPWVETNEENVAQQNRGLYEQHIGSLNDPNHLAAVQQTIDSMNREMAQAKMEQPISTSEELFRRFQERDARRLKKTSPRRR